VLCSRVRLEEKLLFQALRNRGVDFERIDVRQVTFDLTGTPAKEHPFSEFDAVLIRCVSYSRALYAARLMHMQGIRAVNPYQVMITCGDKMLTTLALAEHGVPTPRTAVAFSETAVLARIEKMGYPAVLKPPVGSWGRLMAKVNDRQAAEAVLEHKMHDAKCRAQEVAFYVQDYVDKPGRDIRTLVVGDETIYAVYRHSSHWITNTARGGHTSSLAFARGDEVDRLSRAAARAVGGGVVAVDLLEAPDGSLLVNEVNHTPEFHGAMQAAGVDIAGRIVDYVVEAARSSRRVT